MTRYRCSRGHFLPRDAEPDGDPHDWDDACRCVTKPRQRPRRPRRRRWRYTFSPDLWGQGLSTRRRGRPVRTVTLTGSYL